MKRQPDMAQLDELVGLAGAKPPAEPVTHRTPREGRGDEARGSHQDETRAAGSGPENLVEKTQTANFGRKEKTA